MKRFNQQTFSGILIWAQALMLAVPNVALSAAGQLPPVAAAANILLPAGIYLLLMSWSGNIGRNIVLSLPLTVIAAFQIVLLYLYADGSVIAVDMFLNVATTNSSEAMELLGNLANAVLIVMIMYLPVLTAGIIFWTRGIRTSHRQRHFARITGLGAAVAGAAAMAISYSHIPHYKAEYDIFPVNALFNLQEAVHRKIRTDNYAATSSEYTFNVSNTPPDKTREIYVAVVGETSRADNYQIFGYDRFTTPLLNTVDSLVAYEKVLSESNTTHKSVPMLLSTIEADEYNDSIYVSKSIITAFKEAGFHTAFLSMQSRNRSFIDFFGEEADTTIFVREQHATANGQNITDLDILPYLDSLLVSIPDQKVLIVLHLYGSHFNYNDRYNRSDVFFLPDKTADASPANRTQLINAYDNTIRHTDRLLYQLIQRLDTIGCPGAMLYTSDHGEDIFDDGRLRFLHASPSPTFTQLHVPLILWANEEYRNIKPQKWRAAHAARHDDISSSESCSHTLLDMADIATPRLKPQSAITSGKFEPVTHRQFLNDRNRSVNLIRAGFTQYDLEMMQKWDMVAPSFTDGR